MAFPRRLLHSGEVVVVDVRTHPKALVLPAVWLVLVAAVAGFASSYPSGDSAPLVLALIWSLALVVVVVVAVAPFLRWLTTTCTVTNHRLFTRSGVFLRRGHELPVSRITDLEYERGLVDRLLGCGTLIVSDAGEGEPMRLVAVPHVEQVHREISRLLFTSDERVDGRT